MLATIAELGERIRQRRVSPVDLARECLERIERHNSTLNAFITVTADQALEDARRIEAEIARGQWKGPLSGIPIGVKDFFDTAGVRTTAAFEPFKNRIPAKDAELVARAKEAGAIVIGKTNMHTLGMGTTSVTSSFGAVRNPWNAEYVAGGSSGGSAAAVAAGLCYATIDTDAIGSCRLPASCCGVIGFKATYGLLSPKGILEGERADEGILKLGHAAFTCRDVEDAAILLNVLANAGASDSPPATDDRLEFPEPRSPRIGIVPNFKGSADVRRAFAEAVETLRSSGLEAIEIAPIEFPTGDLAHIDDVRKTISRSLFGNVDVLVLPTTVHPTPTIREAEAAGPMAVSSENTFFANYYGIPATTIPCGFDAHDMPLGLQIVGPRSGETRVLSVAHAFQRATEWHLREPESVG
jgi:aspartyl-tRNA(Asn)/glutamyl-tRNA(Gln) amidotransferase subunit A